MAISDVVRENNKNITELFVMSTYVALASEPIASNTYKGRGSRMYATLYFERRRLLRRIRNQLRAKSN